MSAINIFVLVLSVFFGEAFSLKDCPPGSSCIFQKHCPSRSAQLGPCDQGKVCCASHVRPAQSSSGYPSRPTSPSSGYPSRPTSPSSGYQPPNAHKVSRPAMPIYYYDFFENGYTGRPLPPDTLAYVNSYRYSEECGVRKAPHGRISTGHLVDHGLTTYAEYPWHAAILIKVDKVLIGHNRYRDAYRYHCGASLITNGVVLTAAHCVKGIDKEMLKVKMGDWNLQGSKGERFPPVSRAVHKIIFHEEFNAATLSNDVALLILNRPVDLRKTPHIAPVCLAPKDYVFEEHTKCYIIGWGMDIYKPNYGSNILKKASVTLIEDEDCKRDLVTSLPFLNKDFFDESHKCFKGGYGKDACVGDGGGAVVCPVSNEDIKVCHGGYRCDPEHYFVAGVVSWGSDVCGNEDSVTVYTDMAKKSSWIHNRLAPAGGLSHYNHFYWYNGDLQGSGSRPGHYGQGYPPAQHYGY